MPLVGTITYSWDPPLPYFQKTDFPTINGVRYSWLADWETYIANNPGLNYYHLLDPTKVSQYNPDGKHGILIPLSGVGVNCDAAYSDGTIVCVDGQVLIREGTTVDVGWKPPSTRGAPVVVGGVNYYGRDAFDGHPPLLDCPCREQECDPTIEDCDGPNIPPEEQPDVEGTCECMSEVLGSIAELAAAIRDKASCEVMDCKSILDKCLEDIVAAVLEELEPTVTSCNDCCDKIRSGVEMAVADRIACATCACDEVERQCSVADLQPGERCTQCGQENCCCSENYECGPCEDEPQDDDKYYGYCNANTGQVIVLKGNERPPSGPWRRLSASDESSIAYQEAVRLCVKPEQGPQQPKPPNKPSIAGIPACSLSTFATATNAGSYLQGALEPFTGAYLEDLMRSNAQNIFNSIPKPDAVDALFAALLSTQTSPIPSAIGLGPLIAKSIGCNENAFAVGLTGLASVGLFQQWTGVDIGRFCDPLFYALNATCRRKQLDIDKAMAAFLANAISDSELDTHWAIAGYCPEALINYKEAARAKPVPLQLAFLRRRKLISEAAYEKGMRRLGYLDSTDISNLFSLTEQVPTQSDLIRMMVRDTDNESVVSRFDLDSGFENVFGGQLKEWAEFQGVSEKSMRYNWRAHWSIPSPTQLANMLHRLPVIGGFGDRQKVLEDVEAALIQQDILPFWIPRLLAISYNPLTRIDVRRAFNIGAIGEDAVYNSYLELGYADASAKALTEFSVRLRNEAAVSHKAIKLWLKFAITGSECKQRMIQGGLPETVVEKAMADAEIGFENSHYAKSFLNGELRADGLLRFLLDWGVTLRGSQAIISKLSWRVKTAPPLQQYIIGTIDTETAVDQLVTYGMAERRAVKLVIDVDHVIDRNGASACERGVKDRFLTGEISWEQAVANLQNYGITQQRAKKLADWWSCERSSNGKAIAINRLCEWAERGAISVPDFQRRLVQTGYSEDDSYRIVGDCSHKIGLKRANEAIKIAKQEAAEQQRAQRLADRMAARVAQERAKAERKAEAAKKTRKNRQNQLLSASAKLGQNCNCPLTVAFAEVQAQYARVQRDYGLTPDESLQVLLQAAESYSGSSEAEYGSVVDLFAEQAAAIPLSESQAEAQSSST